MIIGATRVPDARSRECSAFKDDALQAILSSDSMDTVSVAGRWEAAYSGVLPKAGGFYRAYWIDEDSADMSAETTLKVFERGLLRTAQAFVQVGKRCLLRGGS